MHYWELKYALDCLGEPAPSYHAGAVRYFKEINAWTPAHEAWNQKAYKRQQLLKAAWEESVAEAAEKKITLKDFPDFWEKKKSIPKISFRDPLE